MSAVVGQATPTGCSAGLGGEPHPRRDSAAFLVRIWMEPTTADGTEGVVRCYMKNLKTGEEQYMPSADALANRVLAQLDRARPGGGVPFGVDSECESSAPGPGSGADNS